MKNAERVRDRLIRNAVGRTDNVTSYDVTEVFKTLTRIIEEPLLRSIFRGSEITVRFVEERRVVSAPGFRSLERIHRFRVLYLQPLLAVLGPSRTNRPLAGLASFYGSGVDLSGLNELLAEVPSLNSQRFSYPVLVTWLAGDYVDGKFLDGHDLSYSKVLQETVGDRKFQELEFPELRRRAA